MSVYDPVFPIAEVKRHWGDPWRTRPWLDAIRVCEQLGNAQSNASFSWRYGSILRPGETAFATATPFLTGLQNYYVRVIDLYSEQVLFHGVITNDTDNVGGSDVTAAGTGDQMLSAYGLEYLLIRSCVDGAYIVSNGQPVKVDTAQPFNLRTSRGLGLSGNRSSDRYDGPNGTSYVFGGTDTWTAKDMLEYLLAFFGPSTPKFTLEDSAGTGNLALLLDAWESPETVAEGITRVVRRQRGHGWGVVVGGGEEEEDNPNPQVRISPVFSEPVNLGPVTLQPNAWLMDLDLASDPEYSEELNSLQVRRSSDQRIDELLVTGEEMLVAGSVTAAGGTLLAAWKEEEQTTYVSASESARKKPELEDVFRSFMIDTSDPAKIFDDGDGNKIGCPACTDEGKIELSSSGVPTKTANMDLTRKTLSPRLPIKTKGAEQFYRPMVFAELTIGEKPNYFNVHTMADEYKGAPNVHVYLLDDKPGLRLSCTPPHLFAKDTFTGTAKSPPIFDYNKLRATLAIRSDERLKLRVKTGGSPISDSKRTMHIHVPGAEAWVVLKGTVVGVDKTELEMYDGDRIIRNDIARLQSVAALAKSWYGRGRQAVEIEWNRIVTGLMAGDLINTISVNGQSRSVATLITKIEWDFDRHTTTVQTDFSELDFGNFFGGRGGVSIAAPPTALEAAPSHPVQLAAEGGNQKPHVRITSNLEIEDALTGPPVVGSDPAEPTCVEWVYSIEEVEITIVDGVQTVEKKTDGLQMSNCFNRAEAGNRAVVAGGIYKCGVPYNQINDENGDYGPPFVGQLNPIANGIIVEDFELTTGTLEGSDEVVTIGLFTKDNIATGVCI